MIKIIYEWNEKRREIYQKNRDAFSRKRIPIGGDQGIESILLRIIFKKLLSIFCIFPCYPIIIIMGVKVKDD